MQESNEHRALLRQGNKEVIKTISQFIKNESHFMRLDFSIYSSDENDASNVAIELNQLGYKVWVENDPDDKSDLCITGHTPPMDLSDESINTWTDNMCRLAEEHNCFFDGWGTLINQKEEDFAE